MAALGQPDGKFPILDYVVASVDGAFTENEENDPSAMTVWGVFMNEHKRRRIILVSAWRKHLKFSAPKIDRLTETTIIDGQPWAPDIVLPGMSAQLIESRNALYRRRCMGRMGPGRMDRRHLPALQGR